MQLQGIDQIIFGVYIVGVILFGVWIANREKTATASDYFLASRSLPWWAVGGSLIASNISAEQIIGMNGSGFELGLAIATYELMAAITLIIVAKFLLPVFIKKEIYTMPQFLEERYDGTVRTIMSVFWIILFVFVNISTVLYLGALAIEQLLGVEMWIGIVGLVLYSACFSIFGGLKAVVWTDVVQVVVLMLGGTVAAWGILSVVGEGNVFTGISTLVAEVPGHFEMLFDPADSYTDTATGETKSSFNLLPGFALLFGGMWIVNTYYWGNNQYIIQRALAAKSLPEAQKGIAFAAFMKLFIPFFAVLPGIAAYYLMTKKGVTVDIAKADQAFPWILGNYVGPGFKGLTFAALVAAIGSSISSMVNSASTIFTIDIYNKFINPGGSERRQVAVGQIAATVSLLVGAAMAPLLAGAGQVFQVIQEYTGFISPGVLTVFIFGMFYRRGTAKAALAVVLLSVPLSLAFKVLIPDLPFLDRMALIFLISSALMILLSAVTSKKSRAQVAPQDLPSYASSSVPVGKLVSDFKLRNGLAMAVIVTGVATAIRLLLQPVPGVPAWTVYLFAGLSVVVLGLIYTDKQEDDYKAIDLEPSLFRTRMGFNIAAIVILLILAVIYGFLA
ncbi:sodium/solute symporter [Neolewinella lacunae]|uniref:Sodium/solute symporter n=1 Tax=Neolewinella lacunae TaxID=1517758 RepID=A0A923PQV7_9BACT|nr:sodium/solute symporter [Neolewinella lacunae]MBC6995793.1 sodium/solute symporter [Neolewinella lacunae]MDN3636514.1 sodium/solute symporter [Neolewinella lacunae]